MGIVINDNLITFSPKSLDDRYGPYSSVSAANTAIVSTVRYSGLTVGIYSGNTTTEYWYKTGITDTDLVIKSTGGGGGSGTSGTSGTSGAQGPQGPQGPSGASGCPTESVLFASHSSAWYYFTLGSDEYVTGVKNGCGWDSCELDQINVNTRDANDPLNLSDINVGIPISRVITDSCTVHLCGIAYIDSSWVSGDDFGISVQYFLCPDDINGGNITCHDFGTVDYYTFNELDSGKAYTCFDWSYTPNYNLNLCETFLVVGFQPRLSGANNSTRVQISWSLNMQCNC